MATPNPKLIQALRTTARKLENGGNYQWGHMGSCNCGNLAQELTKLSKAEIHAYAMQRSGDWYEQTLEFCPSSGYPMDLLIEKLLEEGLKLEDLRNLERLSDQEVLRNLPQNLKYLNQNCREDVVLYMKTWADMLENKAIDAIELEDLKIHGKKHIEKHSLEASMF